MDYGFAPRDDRENHLERLRHQVKLRPDVDLIHDPRTLLTLEDFIDELKLSSNVERPVHNLLVGAHAHRSGRLDLTLFRGAPSRTEFEDLENALTATLNRIKIPDSLIDYSPTGPDRFFEIKGCNIGKAKPFLVKMREALGNHIGVTAPKHYHGITRIDDLGVFEWMAYEFVISRKQPIRKKRDLLAAFQSATDMKTIDGKAVPADQWATWMKRIPSRIRRTVPLEVRARLGMTIGKRTRIPTQARLKVKRPSKHDPLVPYTLEYTSSAAIPKSHAIRLQRLREELRTDIINDPTHPFPMFRRYGYSSFDDFFENFVWNVYTEVENTVPCWGGYYEYTLQVPITATGTDLDPYRGTLLFNFYPEPGVTAPPDTHGIPDGDPRFFEMVS